MEVYRKGKQYIVEFDVTDLPIINTYNAKWLLKVHHQYPDKAAYIYCSKRDENKKVIQTALHRMLMGFPKEKVVDHIDRNPLNNKRNNLRICTNEENSRNRSKSNFINGNPVTSIYKGVSKNKITGTFCVKFDRQYRFYDEIAAANFYNHMAKEIYGEFASLNEVPYMSMAECLKKGYKKTSKYKGVHFGTERKKWVAQVYNRETKKQKLIGYFKTEELAYEAILKTKEKGEYKNDCDPNRRL